MGSLNLTVFARQVLVHTDFNLLQVCDAKTLEPKRLITYAEIDPELAGYGICAHPPKDRVRGQTFNYIISNNGVMSVFGLDIRAKPAKLLWKTPLPCKPCYIHSLAMTDRFIVFIRIVSFSPRLAANRVPDTDLTSRQQPIHMDVSDPSKPVMEMLTFEPESPTQFFVLDKFTGEQ